MRMPSLQRGLPGASGAAAVRGGEARESVLVTNARHAQLLEEARSALGAALDLLDSHAGVPEEIVLSEVQRARGALEQVTGARTTDDLLREIFATFCVGK